MDYTEVKKTAVNSNIFRVMDEITSCMKSIEKVLSSEKYKFNATKLELGFGGYAYGAYFSMLYGYSLKKGSPIPIKFIIHLFGLLNCDPHNWYSVSKFKSTLSDINQILLGIQNGTLIKSYLNESNYIVDMRFLGFRYSPEEIYQILKDDKLSVNHDNVKYQSLYNNAKYFFM